MSKKKIGFKSIMSITFGDIKKIFKLNNALINNNIIDLEGLMNKIREMSDNQKIISLDTLLLIANYAKIKVKIGDLELSRGFINNETKLQKACRILGVSDKDPIDLVKKIAKTKSAFYHPDKYTSDEEKILAEQKFKEIQEAICDYISEKEA